MRTAYKVGIYRADRKQNKSAPHFLVQILNIKGRRVYPKVSRLAAWSQNCQWYQLSATRCSFIAVLRVSLVSFAAITLCVASQRVFSVVSLYFVMTQSGNFWIHPPTYQNAWNLSII